MLRRCGPFFKRVCQSENGFRSSFCTKGAMGEGAFLFASEQGEFCVWLSLSVLLDSVVVATGSCDRSLQKAVARNIFLRKVTAHDNRQQLCPIIGHGRCGFILVGIPRRTHDIAHVVPRRNRSSRLAKKPQTTSPRLRGSLGLDSSIGGRKARAGLRPCFPLLAAPCSTRRPQTSGLCMGLRSSNN